MFFIFQLKPTLLSQIRFNASACEAAIYVTSFTDEVTTCVSIDFNIYLHVTENTATHTNNNCKANTSSSPSISRTDMTIQYSYLHLIPVPLEDLFPQLDLTTYFYRRDYWYV
jgi:hypothetical protein